jgi:large subunit ribosomal protein L18
MSVTLNKKLRFKNKVDTTGKYVISVARSNKNLVAQISDPISKKVIFSRSSSTVKKGTKSERADAIGAEFAKFILENKFTSLVFNRNGYLYHGRVKAFVESLRKNKVAI